jgi:hypothetical protein
MRRSLITLFMVAFALAATAADASAQAERFLGAWSLVEWTNVRNGDTFYPYGETPAGQIIYTSTGRMTAALMNPPEDSGGQPQEIVAYWGRLYPGHGSGHGHTPRGGLHLGGG